MKIFIISWQSHHKNAIKIANQLLEKSLQPTIVYSDSNPDLKLSTKCHSICRPNHLYWADKFKCCLDATTNEGVLIIHADCESDDWVRLVDRCSESIEKFPNIGVWAPKIDVTPYSLDISKILKIENSDLYIAALTDGIVFYLSPTIVNRMKKINYEGNIGGWGIDILFCAHSHVINQLVVIDSGVFVKHSDKIRGYNSQSALLQMKSFYRNYSIREKVEEQLLRNFVKYNEIRYKVLKKDRGSN